MLSKSTYEKLNRIVSLAKEMVMRNIAPEDLKTGVDYVSIYAKSLEEYNEVANELEQNGVASIMHPTGNYYVLNEPLVLSGVAIRTCRIHTFDKKHPELGYVDFEVKDYEKFKKKYLLQSSFFSVVNSGEEMIELRDPEFDVRAYFPSGSW